MAQSSSFGFFFCFVFLLVAGLQEGNGTALASCFSELSLACTSTNKKRNFQLKALALTDNLRLNIGWTKYRWRQWSLSLAKEKTCCTRPHELHFACKICMVRLVNSKKAEHQAKWWDMGAEKLASPLGMALTPSSPAPLTCAKCLPASELAWNGCRK